MRTLIMITFSVILFVSCKKKEDKTPATTNQTQPTDGSPSNATTFFGILTSGEYTTVPIGSSPIVSIMARAYFGSQAVTYATPSSAVKVNNVSINGDTLTYDTNYKEYYLYSGLNLSTEAWSVNGANGIATFSLSNNVQTPSCNGFNTLPDSVSKSVGFSAQINNVPTITRAYIFISDGSNNLNGSYSINLNSGNNTVNFTPAQLSTLTTGTNSSIGVVLSNGKAFYFSGKSYQFNREAQYNKMIKIYP